MEDRPEEEAEHVEEADELEELLADAKRRSDLHGDLNQQVGIGVVFHGLLNAG